MKKKHAHRRLWRIWLRKGRPPFAWCMDCGALRDDSGKWWTPEKIAAADRVSMAEVRKRKRAA